MHGHPRLPPTPSDPSCVVIPTQMRSQLSPQCHHLSATTPSLQGAQGVSFLQFPEHLLGPGLELGVVIRNNRVSVSQALSIVSKCHPVADSGTGQVLGTRPVGANKSNRTPSPLEFTTWEGRQTQPRQHTNCVVAIGLPITG